MRWQGRLGANLSTFAFNALKQGSFFSANVRACADTQLDVEAMWGSANTFTQKSGFSGDGDRFTHRDNRCGILGSAIDEAARSTGRNAGDHHAFDELEGITLHEHPIRESSAVTFVGVTDDVFLISRRLTNRAPLNSCRKACSTPAAQPRLRYLINNRRRTQ